MVRMKPLFLGLTEMYKHKITHLDISKNNITFDGEVINLLILECLVNFQKKENILIGVKAEFDDKNILDQMHLN